MTYLEIIAQLEQAGKEIGLPPGNTRQVAQERDPIVRGDLIEWENDHGSCGPARVEVVEADAFGMWLLVHWDGYVRWVNTSAIDKVTRPTRST